MCDYSLMNLPNRLASAGEALVTHRFPSGSVGLASPEEVQAARVASSPQERGFCHSLRKWLFGVPAGPIIRAVCLPPGARLKLYGIPEVLQRSARVSAGEEVTFTQATISENRYRDAIRFSNGQQVLLQQIGTGVGVHVLAVGLGEPSAGDEMASSPDNVHNRLVPEIVHVPELLGAHARTRRSHPAEIVVIPRPID